MATTAAEPLVPSPPTAILKCRNKVAHRVPHSPTGGEEEEGGGNDADAEDDHKNKRKTKKKKALKWDEAAIEEHDLLRGTRMKVG